MTSTEPALPGGARPTRQRKAVAACLQRFDDFRSAQDIHDLLRQGGENVGLSTVYRRCSAAHHHHLVCRTCGRTVEVEGPTVERWADAVAGEHGFTAVSHTLEIFGTCPDCG
jgi:Fur family ferric uptake transcriptional regulator